MLPGKKYTPEEILRLLRKRAWLILLPLVLGVGAGILAFNRVPVHYKSETLIMIVPQRIPDSYVKSTVTTKVEERLTSISEQIMSRSRLERIITDLDLYKEARAAGPMEDVVQRMRADIKPAVEGKDSMAFRISYISHDPRTAQKVTERLASLLIEESLRDRGNLAESTSQFIESQLEEAKQRLLDHEKKLEAYRRTYSGQLPTQLQGNLQAIQNGQLQLQALSESLNRARERRLLLDRQLTDAQSAPAVIALPGAAGEEAVPMTTAQQLETVQARRDAFLLRYTPDHPDVKSIDRTIRDLQQKLADEARRPVTPAPPTQQLSPAETARQKRIRDLLTDVETVDRQIATNLGEENRLKTLIRDYQAKVDLLPSRESDLVELTRDYSTLQESYASLLKKREDSKLAANLERRQIGEQFKILDPASLPERPFNQRDRLMVLAVGTGAGLMIGLGLVGFLEYRDSSFKSEEDVIRLLSLPVLALVPMMVSAVEQQEVRRRRKWRFIGVAAAVLLVSAAAVAWKL